jgi:thiol-disulfide isomerase/thioredoxin
MVQVNTDRAELAAYARQELRGEAIYKGYRPREAVIEQVAAALPAAHVVVVSGTWCGDCRREVPKMARILEQLPESWSVELRGDDAEVRERFVVHAIPTFLVLDRPGGREIGRIIESPSSSEGLEGDLLAIAREARDSAASG